MSEPDELDRMIEEALASESLRPVPVGFHRNVDKRVRLSILIQRQRRHFRNCIAGAVAIFAGLSGLVGAAAVAGHWPASYVGSIPGVMGMVDYAVAQGFLWGPGVAGMAALVVTSLGIGAIVLETRRYRRLLAS